MARSAGWGSRLSRRQALALLGGAGATLVAAPSPRRARAAAPAADGVTQEVAIEAAETPTTLDMFRGKPLPLYLFDRTLFRSIRIRHGDRLVARFTNYLPEHSSIHWHGVRLANGMDGVPWLTQPPTRSGQSFTYDFVPPDAGTFFFHPHCDVTGQIGRGLEGVLVVEETPRVYATDHLLAIRDWRVDLDQGRFLPLSTDDGAARAGTFGTLRSVNGMSRPDFAVPAGGYARLRLLALDPTRIMEIGIEGAEAAIIAVDGFAAGPLPLDSWRMGMGMRLDLAIRLKDPARPATLVDYFGARPTVLASFSPIGEVGTPKAFDPPALPPHGLAEPDLAHATTIPFVFSSSGAASPVTQPIALPNGEVFDPKDGLCLSSRTFWAVNRTSWPGQGAPGLPQPLASLDLGRSYVLEFLNTTPHSHPIHLHGFGAKVLECSRLARPVHRADTVLLTTKERIRVAFVADRPGDWMLHCHILEHEETGMMGILRVA